MGTSASLSTPTPKAAMPKPIERQGGHSDLLSLVETDDAGKYAEPPSDSSCSVPAPKRVSHAVESVSQSKPSAPPQSSTPKDRLCKGKNGNNDPPCVAVNTRHGLGPSKLLGDSDRCWRCRQARRRLL